MEFFKERSHFRSFTCSYSQLEDILANSSIDSENSTDDDETKRIFQLHKEAFTAVEDASGRMRGYYCLIPLTKDGEKAIKEGVFSLKKLSSSYVRSNKDKYTPMYIAGIYGGNSGIVNAAIIGELQGYLKAHKTRTIYARAQSRDGLYWLRKYNFNPVDRTKDGLGHFYQFDSRRIL